MTCCSLGGMDRSVEFGRELGGLIYSAFSSSI